MTNFKINQINAALQHFFKITENEAYSDYFQDVCKIAVKALEKQIPKKTTKRQYVPNGTLVYGHCPNCDCFTKNDFSYCKHCGQALDWGQEDGQ